MSLGRAPDDHVRKTLGRESPIHHTDEDLTRRCLHAAPGKVDRSHPDLRGDLFQGKPVCLQILAANFDRNLEGRHTGDVELGDFRQLQKLLAGLFSQSVQSPEVLIPGEDQRYDRLTDRRGGDRGFFCIQRNGRNPIDFVRHIRDHTILVGPKKELDRHAGHTLGRHGVDPPDPVDGSDSLFDN